jgi:hypothetical protein
MTERSSDRFRPAWDRFSGRLGELAPASRATLGRIAFAQEIAGLEGALGFRLHPELKSLLRLHNGAADTPAGAFLPLRHRLLGAAEIAQRNFDLLELGWHHPDSPWPQDHLNAHTDRWVPFADPVDGGIAFVDHRSGPTYGHVYEIGIGSGDVDATLWATSLGELFDRLADALEGNAPFLYHRPRIDRGSASGPVLTWDVARRE